MAGGAVDYLYNLVIECLNLFEDAIVSHTSYKQAETSGTGENSANLLTSTTKQTPEATSIKDDGAGANAPPEYSNAGGSNIRHQERSFDLWIKYTGALAMPGASLDDRLQDYDEIREMVAELLYMIIRNLRLLLNTVPPPHSDRRRTLETQASRGEALDGVDGAIDRLHLIAAAIRRSSSQSQKYYLNPSNMREDDDFFERCATLVAKKRFPSARSTLCQQLGASIAARRKRIIVRMRHDEKLGTPREPSSESAPKHPWPSVLKKAVAKGQEVTSNRVHRGFRVNDLISQTTLTTVDLQAVARHLRQPAALSAISTGSEIRDDGMEYPSPPPFKEDEKHIACHFCSAPLLTSQLKKFKKYWETHVDGDVQPYVCLSEDCARPPLFFVHMGGWLEHMRNMHSAEWTRRIHMTTWYCDSGHDLKQFEDLEGFQSHMRDLVEHPQQAQPPTDVQLAALSRRKQQLILRDEYVCPLCDCVPGKIEPVIRDASAEELRLLLEKHIAAHIKSLALLSLPALDDNSPSIDEISNPENEPAPKDRSQGGRRNLPSGLDSDIEKVSLSFDDLGLEQIDLREEQQVSVDALDNPMELTEDDHWDFYWQQQSQPELDPQTDPVIAAIIDFRRRHVGRSSEKTIDDFIVLEEISERAETSKVRLMKYQRSGRKSVIKYVLKRRVLIDAWTRDRRLGTVPLEIHILDYLERQNLGHPNIVRMVDFFEDDEYYYIEMVPLGLPGMDLFDYVELRTNMDQRECRDIFSQVAKAVHHLHTKAYVVHRDISDENVVINGEGHVQLADFGSAAYLRSGPFDVFVGTIDLAAPEILAGKAYGGKEQDVWALGILLYTLIYKENPFYNIDEIMDRDLKVPYMLSEESLDLIRNMLNRDVTSRYSIEEVLAHPWFQLDLDEAGVEEAASPKPTEASISARRALDFGGVHNVPEASQTDNPPIIFRRSGLSGRWGGPRGS
ncbi:Fc.00g112990.m01.CDS01 [Cosmosporella sp. VM-42]